MYLHLSERMTLLLVMVLLVYRVGTLTTHAVVTLLPLHDLRRTTLLRSCYRLLGYLLDNLVSRHGRCLGNCCRNFTHLQFMKIVIWGDEMRYALFEVRVIQGTLRNRRFFQVESGSLFLNTSFNIGVKIAYSGLGGIFKLILEVHEALLLLFLPRSFRLHDLFLGDMLSFIRFLLGRS